MPERGGLGGDQAATVVRAAHRFDLGQQLGAIHVTPAVLTFAVQL
jgi:hypothetical protein